MTSNVDINDLILGDKNAIMVASRILAYGPEYECTVKHPITGESITTTINLADCPFKEISEDINSNEFEVELPVSKKSINR